MFVFGVCAGPTDKYATIARPGLGGSKEIDSLVVVLRDQPSIAIAYNRIITCALDAAAEGLILIHDDVWLDDPALCPKLRRLFSDPDVAIAGVIGSRDPVGAAWWAMPTVGFAVDYGNVDGSARRCEGDPGAGIHEVDALDGLFLALSRWSLRNLRFDERYPGFHGYDADICAQARRHGKLVKTLDVQLEHKAKYRPGIREGFRQADLIWKSKWRTDQPWWRRACWRARGKLLPLECRLRRVPWRA